MCNGQLLPINQKDQALFALLGTTYGGNGTNELRIAELCGSHAGAHGQWVSAWAERRRSKSYAHPLRTPRPRAYADCVECRGIGELADYRRAGGTGDRASERFMDRHPGGDNHGARSPIANLGGSQPSPTICNLTLVITACIALQGIFPSQN